jgi:hypothetical protein
VERTHYDACADYAFRKRAVAMRTGSVEGVHMAATGTEDSKPMSADAEAAALSKPDLLDSAKRRPG